MWSYLRYTPLRRLIIRSTKVCNKKIELVESDYYLGAVRPCVKSGRDRGGGLEMHAAIGDVKVAR